MLDRLSAKAGQLYSLPAVAMKVLELTRNPRVDVAALKECIENDPALTGKILRVVNSSLFGLSREVSDLNQALALLGIKPLKMLVLGFSLPPGLYAGVSGDSLARYWRHTLTKAVAGREISETLWKKPGDDAFIACLLQDIGELLLMQELGEPYTRFLDKAHAGGNDLATLEIETLGFDHTALSTKLLASWGLPETIVETVGTTKPSRQAEKLSEAVRNLSQIVYMGELVARLLVDGHPEALRALLAAGRYFRDISQSQLETLVGDLQEKVHQLADVLSLQLPEGMDHRDVLAGAHAQLSGVAGEAAEDMLRRQQEDLLNENMVGELQVLSKAVAETSARSASERVTRDNRQVASDNSPPASAAVGETLSTNSVPVGAAAESVLLDQMASVVAACRQSRCSVSLLLLALNNVTQWPGGSGDGNPQGMLEDVCRNMGHRSAICQDRGPAGFALVLPDCERREAVELGNQIINKFRTTAQVAGHGGNDKRPASLGVGAATVALPPKNFPSQDLFTAADRCLYGSHASGGGVVKSIEIY